jgi:hypothetical protein
MAFLDTYRDIQNAEKTATENVKNYEAALDKYIGEYNSWRKTNGMSVAGADAKEKLMGIIDQLGRAEGKLNKDSNRGDVAAYGLSVLDDLNSGFQTDFGTYVNEKGTKEQREAWEGLQSIAHRNDGVYVPDKAPDTWGEAIWQGIQSGASGVGKFFDYAGNAPRIMREDANKGKWERTISNMEGEFNKYNAELAGGKFDLFDNPDKYISGATAKAEETAKASESSASDSKSDNSKSETTDETVTFQLKANDPAYKGFGQKLVDLGLATSKGLWGNDGDVKFYTKQLYEQGAIDKNGNLKTGTPIKLKKRKIQ